MTLCVREPATVRPGQLEDAAARVEDWQEAGNLAGAHRVAAFVRAACRKITQPIPASVDQMLRQASMVAAARVMLLDATLARISRGFAAASVPVTVLKGPALARTIYPQPELRPYGDLDLTIHAHDEGAATEILEQFGLHEIPYEAEQARAAHADHVHGASPYHRKFADDSGQVLVELHLDSLQIGMRPTCEAGRWQRAQPLPSMPGVLMLGPEDQLVQLSVHAHKHGFERLIWIKDIDLLLRANGDRLQWSVVRAVAGGEGVTSSVWYSVLLAHRILGMPVPPAAMAMLTQPAPVRALYSLLWPTARIAGLKGFSRRRAVQFHAAESWRGMLPSLLLMGRRRTRMRAIVQQLVGR